MTSQDPPGALPLPRPLAARRLANVMAAVACLAWMGFCGCGPAAGPGPPAGSEAARAELRRLVDSGRRLHDTLKCAACHAPEGQPSPAPSLKGIYGVPARLLSGKERVRDEAYLTLAITDPLAEVLDGYSPSMPPYGHLDPEQVRALVHFIKSLSPGTEESAALKQSDE